MLGSSSFFSRCSETSIETTSPSTRRLTRECSTPGTSARISNALSVSRICFFFVFEKRERLSHRRCRRFVTVSFFFFPSFFRENPTTATPALVQGDRTAPLLHKDSKSEKKKEREQPYLSHPCAKGERTPSRAVGRLRARGTTTTTAALLRPLRAARPGRAKRGRRGSSRRGKGRSGRGPSFLSVFEVLRVQRVGS